MDSIKLLLSFFAILNFIEVYAANGSRSQGIVFETEDTNKNRTATHVSVIKKIKKKKPEWKRFN